MFTRKLLILQLKCELGRLPILSHISLLTFRYYFRLNQLPSNRLVKEAFEVDRGLFNEKRKSWHSFIFNSAKNFKKDISKISEKEIPTIINNYYVNSINEQLNNLQKPDTDSKLNTFASCYKDFKLQSYLDFNLPKNKVKFLTKLRISAHILHIEKGRYSKPKLPRNLRLCSVCNELENEEHFILHCKKFMNLRNKLFSNLNLDDKTSTTFSKLINPNNTVEAKLICDFIQSAFSCYFN